MRTLFACIAAHLLIVVALFLPGCAGTSPSLLHTPYFSSRDGILHYRLPAGWFDATNDSIAAGNAVWLLRQDYAATISVSEVHLDEAARQELDHNGLLGVARLTMALAISAKPAITREEPRLFQIGGSEFCSFEYTMPSSGDALRVVLFDTGEKLYEVTALVSGEKRGTGSDVFAVEQEFLGSLRW